MLALLLGVAAMHSLAVPIGADHAMPPATATTSPHPDGGSIPGPLVTGSRAAGPAAGTAAVEIATAQPATAVEQIMHLCLAMLTALIILGLWAVTYLLATGYATARGPRPLAMVVTRPRAPPPTAVRLAQLCVLRN
ncbi:hypothetical protein TOK_5464 [Pseudonocardia sp. N23]|nr:hypothetical protein TOK_5464 [Pseudonocardia sp. N23]